MDKTEGVVVAVIGALMALFGPVVTGGSALSYLGVVIAIAGLIAMWVAHYRADAAQQQDSTR